MLKLCQRESIFASDKHGCSLARSPPMCRGLDLLPDWDTPHIRDEFNFWGGICKQHQTHLTSSSSRGKHRHLKEKERLIAALGHFSFAGVLCVCHDALVHASVVLVRKKCHFCVFAGPRLFEASPLLIVGCFFVRSPLASAI